MPSYKLYYFPIRARGELPRLVFAAAGVEYEDVRYTFEEWPAQKQRFPFRQIPVLEVDGKFLSQGYAIARFLASEFGLLGKNKWEIAEADMYTGAVEDLLAPAVRINFEKDETAKAEGAKKYVEETAPNYLQAFEKALEGNSSGFLVGDGLTYADLAFLNYLQIVESILKDDAKSMLSKFPNIQAFQKKIESLPKIADWLSRRPKSDI